MEQWLTRTAKNWISGPYSKEQVCKMITDGNLGVQDEVCPANGYWVLLHERKEVFDLLGIEVPRIRGSQEEVTDVDITTETKDESPQGLSSQSESEDLASSNSNPEATTFLVRGSQNKSSQRHFQVPVAQPNALSAPSTHEVAEDEDKADNNRGLSIILLGLGVLLLIALRIFKHHKF